MWKVMGNEQFIRGVWEYFTLKRAEVKKILDDGSRERQEGIQGQWQQESPFREIMEQVRGNADMRCSAQMIRKSFFTISAQIFVCVVTRSTTAEVQHNDMMMWTNVQMT